MWGEEHFGGPEKWEKMAAEAEKPALLVVEELAVDLVID